MAALPFCFLLNDSDDTKYKEASLIDLSNPGNDVVIFIDESKEPPKSNKEKASIVVLRSG
jgi:hypothetical protein